MLFVNAGIAGFAPVGDVDAAFFDRQFNLNVRGAYFTIKHALEAMPDGGAIVLTASVAGTKGFAGTSVYSATKAALRSFGRTLAAELIERKIRVNTISPGPIDTPIFGKGGGGAEAAAQSRETFASYVPMKRLGSSDEVAHAALFLASDAASFITGAELAVDGGLSYF